MRTGRLLVVVAAIAIFGFTWGCNKPKHGMNALITKPGTYAISPTRLLIVSIENGILNYNVSENGRNLLKSIERPSAYQRWHLFYDSHNRLWAYNSDQGGVYVWVSRSGVYTRHEVKRGDEWVPQLPLDFKKAMAMSVLRTLE